MTKILFEEEKIFKATSHIIKESINKTLLNKNEVILGLPGGRSISKVLEQLKKESMNWSKIHVFMVDERIVTHHSPKSNFHLINHSISDNIPTDNLHPFIFNEGKIDYAIQKYKNELTNFGGLYDVVLLSSGEDGHIGSLFPNHPSIFDNSDFYVFVNNSPKPPKMRMSISKNLLIKSNIGILLFIGDEKRDALVKFLDENTDYKNYPAKLVSELPESHIITNINVGL